ncbi:MAG TPA: DUF4190 domain-containing protein [Asanoa sp.]|jgi:hypothetical protein|nr:DUF4190 domain-containing protein [Asanoa sp.]
MHPQPPQQPYDPYQAPPQSDPYQVAPPQSYDPYQPAPQPFSAAPYPASPVPYQQPYLPQQPVHFVAVPVAPTSGTAVVSLIAGIIGILGGWCVFGVPCAIAIITGHVAQRETKTGARGGNGLAIAGLVLGYIGIVPAVLFTIFFGIGMIASIASPTPTPTP